MSKVAFYTPSPKGGLVPVHLADAEVGRSLTVGKIYKVEIKESRRRSLGQHRLLFALIKIIVENSPCETPLTDRVVLQALKLKTGLVDLAKLPSGEILMFPKSISFQTMPQEEFNEWFEKALFVMSRDFVPDLTVAAARAEIEAIVDGKRAA
jgi:hypothetical protein